MIIKILNLKINLSPREWAKAWGEAIKNTWHGLGETFSNRRLWIGFIVSILLHLLVVLFSIQRKPGEGEEIVELTVEFYDEKYNPKAAKIIQEESKFMPGVRSGITEEAGVLDLERRNIKFQAPIAGGEISLQKGATPAFTGEVLRINPNATVSTEEILSKTPIDLKRGMGGTKAERGFFAMPSVGSPIDLSRASADVERLGKKESPIKRIGPGPGAGKKTAEEMLKKIKKPAFVLEGDLSAKDILAKYMPPYPAWARQRYITAQCRIAFSADMNGNVMPVMTVLKSTGFPQWDEQIKATLRRWRFKSSNLRIRRAVITFIFVLE